MEGGARLGAIQSVESNPMALDRQRGVRKPEQVRRFKEVRGRDASGLCSTRITRPENGTEPKPTHGVNISRAIAPSGIAPLPSAQELSSS